MVGSGGLVWFAFRMSFLIRKFAKSVERGTYEIFILVLFFVGNSSRNGADGAD